ncbi:30801_t:CDS:2, partial [Gigaspora margarita]
MDTEVAEAICKCDSDGPLIIYVTKLYNSSDALTFDMFGQILSGSIIKGQTVKVLWRRIFNDDEEVMTIREVLDVWIFESKKDELSEIEYENKGSDNENENENQRDLMHVASIKKFLHNASSTLEFNNKDDEADKRKQSDCPKVRDIIDVAIVSSRIFHKPMVRQSTSNFV